MYQNGGQFQQQEEKNVIRQLDNANIETEEDTIGYSSVNRVNAKYYILILLIVLSDKEVQDELTDGSHPGAGKAENYRNLYQSLIKEATFSVYTNPAQLNRKEPLSKEYKTIVESQLVENHILGSLKAILFSTFPNKNDKDHDFEIDDIFFKKIIKFEESSEEDFEGREKITYNTSKAIEEIKELLPKFYHGDKLVSEVLEAIKFKDDGEKFKKYTDFLLKKIIAILTSEVKEKERKVNNKKIVEKIITCNTDGRLGSDKKSFISSVTIGDIEFKRESIEVGNFNGKEITYFRRPDKEGKMKRYFINKETNYIFEIPDKDISSLDDDKDKIRIYEISTGRWFDSDRNNAVCKKDDNNIVFSFYDERNKQCVYCSPFSKKVCISNYSNNKFYENISISSFNEKLDSIIDRIEAGVLLDDEIDSACEKIGINIRYNPYVLSGQTKLKTLKIIRRYGMYNTISLIRPDKEECNAKGYDEKKLKKLINAKKGGWFGQKFGLDRDDNDVKTTFNKGNIESWYNIDIKEVENDTDENTRRALETEYFFRTTRADSISILEYENGKVVDNKKAEKVDKKAIENEIKFNTVADTTVVDQEDSCSYSREILNQQNVAGISKIVIEEEISNNPFVRKQDLSEHAYLNYENTKKIEELRESEKKKMKNKRKSNGKPIDYSYINKQYEQMAVNSINYAVKKLYNMEYKSFFEKILIFFGFMKDENPTTYQDLVNSIVKNIGGISFSAKEANYIQGAIDYGATVSGEDRYDISNTVTISLNNLNKGKGK